MKVGYPIFGLVANVTFIYKLPTEQLRVHGNGVGLSCRNLKVRLSIRDKESDSSCFAKVLLPRGGGNLHPNFLGLNLPSVITGTE